MAAPRLALVLGGGGARGLAHIGVLFSGIEILVRATEIALDRQNTLATAMVEPHVLVDVKLGDIGLRDFDRLDEAVAAGRAAAREALPSLRRALGDVKTGAVTSERLTLQIDPVCDMVVSPRRAAARVVREGRAYHFCSATCGDTFLRRGGGRPTSG
jgi:YHS domain-containing protein